MCTTCARLLEPYMGASCRSCALPLSQSISQAASLCGACLQDPFPWECLHSFALYEGLLKRLLLRFKFGQDYALTPLLGTLLMHSATACPDCDVLVPIPQHPTRLRERGMNQAHELARFVAARLRIPLQAQALCRHRATLPQTRLRAAERRRNPEGSFVATDVRGLTILLCDDTMTTGATLRHAALTLRAAGAVAVHVAVIARAVVQGTHTQNA